ncbi:MAG TPA: DUF4249 family protein, partial [Puia sp.]|nr:DUF4249 family protein [Puia sp.]
PTGASRYYRWAFDQTYEYHAARSSSVVYDDATQTVEDRPPGQQIYRCWKDYPSTQLMLSTTAKLSQDIVYRYPLVHIPFGDQALSVLYSLQVTQYVMTSDAYNYYLQLLANTESLGSVFDILPTQLTGNIHNVADPTEPVIGYISAGTAAVQRIYIHYNDLFYWEYDFECPGPDIQVTPDSTVFYFADHLFTPIAFGAGVYVANQTTCVDCTANGGTNQKPAYWPN